jgi:ABC-type multidrug transport system fused ATPase/permease subunit
MNESRLQRVLSFLYPYRWHMAWLVGLTAGLSVLAMVPPLLTRAVINRVITNGERSLLFTLGSLMLLMPVLNALCSYLQVMGTAYVGQKFVMDFRGALYRHLLSLSMRFYGREPVGKTVNRLMGDTGVLQSVLTVSSVQIVSDFVCSAFAITVTFSLNWRLASLLILIVVLFVVNYKLNIARIRRVTRGYRGAEDRVAGGVQNRLVADLTVKTFGKEDREHGVFRAQSQASLDLIRASEEASNTFSMNTALLRDVGRIVVFFLGCALVLQDRATYGDVVAFTTYAMQLLAPALRFSYLARQIQDVRISMDRLFEIFDEKPEIVTPPNAFLPRRVRGLVDFNHVMFHYQKDRPILRDIDFHVTPGEMVALVGPTGCGKSTILSLLMRFFDVVDGSIRIDGHDVREMDLRALRRQFGIVLQESLLFNCSVTENIRYSRPTASPKDVENAARVAEIHDEIMDLPDGYRSEIGREEIQLSVGQKQRISIARAVLADPAVLIMDEATSALDSESERAIQLAMGKLLAGRTSFIVAHRLGTIRNAHRIILLDKGRIREMGTHEQLMAIPRGRYRSLYNRHAGRGLIQHDE